MKRKDFRTVVGIFIIVLGVYFYNDMGVPLVEQMLHADKEELGGASWLLFHFLVVMFMFFFPLGAYMEYYDKKDKKVKAEKDAKKMQIKAEKDAKKRAMNLFLSPYKKDSSRT